MSHAHLVKCNGQKQGGQDKDASGQKRLLIGGSRFLLGQIVGIGPELFGSRSGRTIGILFIPVSYTHLDVYKRQVDHISFNEDCGSRCIEVKGIAVPDDDVGVLTGL